MTEEEKQLHFFKTHMMDLFRRACSSSYPVFSDFLTSGEQKTVQAMSRRFREISECVLPLFWGGHEDCSRVAAGFFPEEYADLYKEMFPVRCICIECLDSRNEKQFTHRDVLGAVMNLGVVRDVIGDIRIKDNCAYLFCREEIAGLILDRLANVGRSGVSCRITEDPAEIPRQEFEIYVRTIASLRLDNVVSAMIGRARKDASGHISQGKVFVDSVPKTSLSFPCKDGMVISVRGYGKYRLQIPEDSLTGKGKQRIQIFRYK